MEPPRIPAHHYHITKDVRHLDLCGGAEKTFPVVARADLQSIGVSLEARSGLKCDYRDHCPDNHHPEDVNLPNQRDERDERDQEARHIPGNAGGESNRHGG